MPTKYCRRWQAVIAAVVLLLPCTAAHAQATDEELLAFVKDRSLQHRITQYPVWIDYQAAMGCAFPQFTQRDLASPHWQKAINVYADQKGLAPMWDPYETFPEGAVLLKEKFDSSKQEEIELFTGMFKREKGFAPEIGDWEFFTIDGTATQVTSRGKLDSCIACHRDYADSDFVSKIYASRASSAFQPSDRAAVWFEAKWDSTKTRICNGSGDTIFLPASLAETRGKSLTRNEARNAWWKSHPPSEADKSNAKSESLPEDLTSVGGPTLRYEPIRQKNTLGCWSSVDDSASWQIAFEKPGRFKVNVLQGCGKGSGGAEVSVTLAGQSLKFTVEDTGGFQEFVWREIGEIDVKTAGQLDLIVQPKTKPGVAVMDLRQIRLDRIR